MRPLLDIADAAGAVRQIWSALWPLLDHGEAPEPEPELPSEVTVYLTRDARGLWAAECPDRPAWADSCPTVWVALRRALEG